MALAVVVLTPMAVHELAAGLVPAAQHLPGLAAAAERVQEVLRQPDPVTEPDAPAVLPAGPYGLRLTRVSARYGDGPLVLDDVDLDLAAGGGRSSADPSGCGKSTLAAVLLRFLDPVAGTVELLTPTGACDVRGLASDDVRRVIKSCAQDPHVFDTTLGDNLRIARPDATDDEVRDALRAARLTDWVDTLPDGLATQVGEHGARLSGGQLPASGPGPGPAGRCAGADPRRADRAPRRGDRGGPHGRRAGGHARADAARAVTSGRAAGRASWDVQLELGGGQPTPSS